MIRIEILGDDIDAVMSDIADLQRRFGVTERTTDAPLALPLGQMIEETQRAAEAAGFRVEVTAPDAETHENVIEMPAKAKRRAKAKEPVEPEAEPVEETAEAPADDLEAFKKQWLPIMQNSCFEPGGADAVSYLRKKFKIRSFTETPAERFPEIVEAFQEKMNGAR